MAAGFFSSCYSRLALSRISCTYRFAKEPPNFRSRVTPGFCVVTPKRSLVALAQVQELHTVQSSIPISDSLSERIGFIGAGQMGTALIKGFFRSGVSIPEKISASARCQARRDVLMSLGIAPQNVFEDATLGGAALVAANSDVILLGVKPQAMTVVLEALAPHLSPRHLVISIAAGVKLSKLENILGTDARIARVMPNTPSLIQQGASAYSLNSNATESDNHIVHTLLSAVGTAVAVDENCMDAVTGLSGSGPAYAFVAMEALADGGVAAGLPRDIAQQLAAQTMLGAAKMVLETGKHPAELKDMVASPAGTTIAGLHELEKGGLRATYINAVVAAMRRSEELA